MPYISKIQLSNFRNMSSVNIEPSPSTNLIVGPNGSGKSSFLEAIGVLAHGKSSRTHKFRPLIKEDASSFVAYGELFTEQNQKIVIGLERQRKGEYRIKVDGEPISSSAKLAANLPLILINANSFKLLDGSPKERRHFFDWLVFHVKHDFRIHWSNYSRCIKQRNSLLRRDKISYSDLEPWDQELVRLSGLIESDRKACFDFLNDKFRSIVSSESQLGEFIRTVQLEYINGWKNNEDQYSTQLREQFEKDHAYGYTTLGPHKADIKIKAGKQVASETLSRGQQKLLVSTLYIAEAGVFADHSLKKPVFAIDDLPAELDADNQRLLSKWVNRFGSQVFITGIDESFIPNLASETSEEQLRVFHVKHGNIQQAQI